MSTLFRFDFSEPPADAPVADGPPKSGELRPWYFRRPGSASPAVPPDARLAFLFVVCLTAGVCSFAIGRFTSAPRRAVADENTLPSNNLSSKLKTAAASLLPTLPPFEETPVPARVLSDNDMSPLVQLPPVDLGLPEIPAPAVGIDWLPTPVRVYDPRPVPPDVPVSIDLPPPPRPTIVDAPPIVENSGKQAPPRFDDLPPMVEFEAKQLPRLDAPPEITVAPLAPELPQDDERIFVYEIHHGESPMLNTWKQLRLASFLAAAMTVAAPIPAIAQEDPKVLEGLIKSMDTDIKAAFKGLRADVKLVDDDVKNLKTGMTNLQSTVIIQGEDLIKLTTKVGELEKNIKDLRRELDDMRQKLPGDITFYAPVTKESFEELKNRLKDIEQKLTEQGSSKRIALAPATTNTGRLMLVNLYNEDLDFRVNGQSYRVPAGRSMPIDNVPAGSVSYEMTSPTWGRRASTTTNLTANETLTLTAQ